MNDLEQKIRLQILVANYNKLASKKDENEKREAEKVIGDLAESVIDWLDEHGQEHQLALQYTIRQLKAKRKYFVGDKDFEFLFKLINNKIVSKEKNEPVKQREIASHTQAAFLLLHLEAVQWLHNVLGTGNLEPAIRKAIPGFSLPDKENTLRKIRQKMNEYRRPETRTGEKTAKSKLKPSKREGDYNRIIILLNALQKSEGNQSEADKIETALQNVKREREIALVNIDKLKRNKLEKEKL